MGSTNLRSGWTGLVQALVDSEGRGIRARILLECVAREPWVLACSLWRRGSGADAWTCVLARGPQDLLPQLSFLQEAAAGRTPADLVPGRGVLLSGQSEGALALTYAGSPESETDLDLVSGLLHVARLIDAAEGESSAAPVEAIVPALPREALVRSSPGLEALECSPAALLASIATSESSLCARSRIEFELDVEPGADAIRVRLPASEFVQAIRNLASNAREALEQAQQGGRIRLSLNRPRAGLACVVVEDSGPGVPQEVQEALRSGAPEDLPGPGLGLAVSWGIALGCSGSLRIASSSESGTRIEFELPDCGPS